MLAGWHLRTAIAIPELPPWRSGQCPAPISVESAEGEERGFGGEPLNSLLQMQSGGDCRLSIPGVATYDVRGGRRVVVRAAPEVRASDVRLFLLGPVLSILCHQRGFLPLQGACIRRDSDCTLLCGPPGIGKSTIAAALSARGWAIVADDIAVLAPSSESRPPLVLETIARLKLWRDSLEALGLETVNLPQVRAGQDRFFYTEKPQAAEVPQDALRLRRVIFLANHAARDCNLAPLDEGRSLRSLRQVVDQARLAIRLCLPAVENTLRHIVGCVPVYRVAQAQPYGFDRIEQTVSQVESLVSV